MPGYFGAEFLDVVIVRLRSGHRLRCTFFHIRTQILGTQTRILSLRRVLHVLLNAIDLGNAPGVFKIIAGKLVSLRHIAVGELEILLPQLLELPHHIGRNGGLVFKHPGL